MVPHDTHLYIMYVLAYKEPLKKKKKKLNLLKTKIKLRHVTNKISTMHTYVPLEKLP